MGKFEICHDDTLRRWLAMLVLFNETQTVGEVIAEIEAELAKRAENV